MHWELDSPISAHIPEHWTSPIGVAHVPLVKQ
jgi:hypothetical protein